MAGGKRGRRRREVKIFEDGSPLTPRPLTELAREMKDGQREFFRQLRRDYSAGPYTSNITISSLEKCSGSEDEPPEELIEAQKAYAEAQRLRKELSENAGNERLSNNNFRKIEIIDANIDLFERGKMSLSINSCAVILQGRLKSNSKSGWVPSLRTLHDWLSDYSRS
jgi:hypothetical protein